MLGRFWDDESGVTAIEYGLIAGLVSVASVFALTALGTTVGAMYNQIRDAVVASMPAG